MSASNDDDGERMCVVGNAAKGGASKQNELVASVCDDEGETVASAWENDEINLHIMDVDVLEARYPRHELFNGTQPRAHSTTSNRVSSQGLLCV